LDKLGNNPCFFLFPLLVHQRMFPKLAKATIPFPGTILLKTAPRNSSGTFDPQRLCSDTLRNLLALSQRRSGPNLAEAHRWQQHFEYRCSGGPLSITTSQHPLGSKTNQASWLIKPSRLENHA
jgi:hypothetical protein